jgi:hypothetical protein
MESLATLKWRKKSAAGPKVCSLKNCSTLTYHISRGCTAEPTRRRPRAAAPHVDNRARKMANKLGG